MNATFLRDYHFQTPRLAFRPVEECDEELCCELYGDASTMRFIGAPLAREKALRSAQRMVALTRSPMPQRIFLVVCESDRPIGIASIQHIDMQHRSAELGLMLLPRARARGYAKEALSALAGKAFQNLPVDVLWVEHLVEHEAAERLVRSVGFSVHEDPDSERRTGKRRWRLLRSDAVKAVDYVRPRVDSTK